MSRKSSNVLVFKESESTSVVQSSSTTVRKSEVTEMAVRRICQNSSTGTQTEDRVLANEKIRNIVKQIAIEAAGQTKKKRDAVEDLENEKFRVFGNILYPVPERFNLSYQYLRLHQSIAWSSQEIDPRDDRDTFATLDPEKRSHFSRCFAVLMFGDSVVLSQLNGSVLERIVSPQVRAMFTDQEARENVHQEIYAKMTDLSDDPEYYRSKQFYDEYLGHFSNLIAHKNATIQEFLFVIMLCEFLMFSPNFLAIMYLGVLGVAPKIVEITSMVMRDENVHYNHARDLLASLKQPVTYTWALQTYKTFKRNVKILIRKLFSGSDPNAPPVSFQSTGRSQYSLETVLEHFEYICHQFCIDNRMYGNEREQLEAQLKHGKSPCEFFAQTPQHEVRVNLMESTSTIYLPDESVEIDYTVKNLYV